MQRTRLITPRVALIFQNKKYLRKYITELLKTVTAVSCNDFQKVSKHGTDIDMNKQSEHRYCTTTVTAPI
jgi:hypothetical protein